ncbi:KaiC domain-containing protein [Halovenus sp. WSH3]|uniref:KaiC domain-containing protein n=1 Tax=Halovenus carboxidivorans TaxID=2692199 RepID=A0A6B0T920_9EURY|nr:KaiC domain-containing protein [Halovenus carboxidivorans]MXR51842.1 KaiC domain-containing protein [Halovenus carboxidivorans]
MSEDDDWFEQALSEDDAEEDQSDDPWDDSADSEEESPWDDDSESSWGDGEAAVGDTTGTDGAAPFESNDTESGPFEDDGFGGEGPFEDDTGFGADEGASFGGGGDESLFDDEGFGGLGGGGDSEFEEEDFESEIPRIDLGIEGLDNMIQGGVPERHLIVTIGSAGTGKTTFGLQFLHHGLQNGEDAVFITLEQSHEAIIATANEFGWDFESFESEDRLAIVDLDPVEMANSLDNIQAELPQLIRDFDADRLVLDSVSLLEMMYDNQAKRRTEVFDFTRSLKKAGVTTFLTSEASESNPYASRHGIIEYLTDAVFVLQYVRGETQETRLAVEIQKIRNANHSREKKPYEMTEHGLSVYQQANIF